MIAKGVKKKKSPQNALLQPSHRLNIAWSGKGELGTLTSIEQNGVIFDFSGKVQIAVFYLNELLIRLLHQHEPHPKLFTYYDQTLNSLSDDRLLDLSLRVFEKNVLEELGYGLVLDHDVETGEQISLDTNYFYQIEYGPVSSKPATGEYVEVSGKTLLYLKQERLEDLESLKEAKYLMRASLNRHLGNKPLASRELYRAYLRQSQDY